MGSQTRIHDENPTKCFAIHFFYPLPYALCPLPLFVILIQGRIQDSHVQFLLEILLLAGRVSTGDDAVATSLTEGSDDLCLSLIFIENPCIIGAGRNAETATAAESLDDISLMGLFLDRLLGQDRSCPCRRRIPLGNHILDMVGGMA